MIAEFKLKTVKEGFWLIKNSDTDYRIYYKKPTILEPFNYLKVSYVKFLKDLYINKNNPLRLYLTDKDSADRIKAYKLSRQTAGRFFVSGISNRILLTESNYIVIDVDIDLKKPCKAFSIFMITLDPTECTYCENYTYCKKIFKKFNMEISYKFYFYTYNYKRQKIYL